jgi:hypothetical membrane protein
MSFFRNYTTYKIFGYIQTILIVVSRKAVFLYEVSVFSEGEYTHIGVPCYFHFQYVNVGGSEDA